MSTARTTRLSRCPVHRSGCYRPSGAASVVLASFLLGALDFALVKATTTPRRVEPFGLLDVAGVGPRLPARRGAAPREEGGPDCAAVSGRRAAVQTGRVTAGGGGSAQIARVRAQPGGLPRLAGGGGQRGGGPELQGRRLRRLARLRGPRPRPPRPRRPAPGRWARCTSEWRRGKRDHATVGTTWRYLLVSESD